MKRLLQLGIGLALMLALGWQVFGRGQSRVRVFVEPSYERARLQRLLALQPGLKVLAQSGTEDVTLLVEAAPAEKGERLPRAAVRARSPRTGYEVHALAQFLPVRNARGGRARWMSSYENGLREDDIAEILHRVVLEAARQEHRDVWRTPAEIQRAMRAVPPSS